MPFKPPDKIKSSEITLEKDFFNRRTFLKGAAVVGSTLATAGIYRWFNQPPPILPELARIENLIVPTVGDPNGFAVDEAKTIYKDITSYNNYYEFGTDKYSPARYAARLVTRPWTIEVGGMARKPQTFGIEDLLKFTQEERVYRFRCVEGWSMVIPWIGFPIKTLLDLVEPLGTAKYVMFETLHDPQIMSSSFAAGINFPYVEGLRLDEALNPLAILATGLYGKVLPNQNGAPVRLIVPWKYGFKSIKSIVKITLTDREPATTWSLAAPSEYGFYSNVNPEVRHPRWSQASEQRIGEFGRRKTLLFNGYAEQVGKLYENLDLKKYF